MFFLQSIRRGAACLGPLLHVLIAGAAGRHIHIRQVGSLQAAGNGSQATAALAGEMGTQRGARGMRCSWIPAE